MKSLTRDVGVSNQNFPELFVCTTWAKMSGKALVNYVIAKSSTSLKSQSDLICSYACFLTIYSKKIAN